MNKEIFQGTLTLLIKELNQYEKSLDEKVKGVEENTIRLRLSEIADVLSLYIDSLSSTYEQIGQIRGFLKNERTKIN